MQTRSTPRYIRQLMDAGLRPLQGWLVAYLQGLGLDRSDFISAGASGLTFRVPVADARKALDLRNTRGLGNTEYVLYKLLLPKMIFEYQRPPGKRGLNTIKRRLEAEYYRETDALLHLAQPPAATKNAAPFSDKEFDVRGVVPKLFYHGNRYGSWILVMSYFPGKVLADIERPTPLLYVKVEKALLSCWLRGVVHLDFHDENIIVTPDNKVKIIDFGRARIFDPRYVAALRTGMANKMNVSSLYDAVLDNKYRLNFGNARALRDLKALFPWFRTMKKNAALRETLTRLRNVLIYEPYMRPTVTYMNMRWMGK